jgi:FAD dependent oxidoreductase
MNDKVAIVGSGLVGRAWAISFARGGHDVVLFDTAIGGSSSGGGGLIQPSYSAHNAHPTVTSAVTIYIPQKRLGTEPACAAAITALNGGQSLRRIAASSPLPELHGFTLPVTSEVTARVWIQRAVRWPDQALRRQVTDLRWDYRRAREHSVCWAVGTHAHDALSHQAKPAPFAGKCRAPYRSWQCAPTRNIRLRFRDILWLTTRHMSQLHRCAIRNIAKPNAGVQRLIAGSSPHPN